LRKLFSQKHFEYINFLIILLDHPKYENNVKIYDTDNEISVLLYLTDFKRDFDQLYVENNYSSVYHYKLKAFVYENPSVFSVIDVYFNLIDTNDNFPSLTNYNITTSSSYVNATLNESFEPDTLININEDYFIIKLNDADFSKNLGVKSIYCYTNDTRFYVDNEFISNELQKIGENSNVMNNGISLLIRTKNSHSAFLEKSTLRGAQFFLNVTCNDNYFQSNLGLNFKSISIVFRIRIKDDPIISKNEMKILRKPVFEKDTYKFNVNESWTGFIGKYVQKLYLKNNYR
jgi:hypothetical protein